MVTDVIVEGVFQARFLELDRFSPFLFIALLMSLDINCIKT